MCVTNFKRFWLPFGGAKGSMGLCSSASPPEAPTSAQRYHARQSQRDEPEADVHEESREIKVQRVDADSHPLQLFQLFDLNKGFQINLLVL